MGWGNIINILDDWIFDVLDLIFDIFGDWIFDRYRVIRVPAKSVTHSSRPNLGKIENVHLFLTFNHVQISSLAPALSCSVCDKYIANSVSEF